LPPGWATSGNKDFKHGPSGQPPEHRVAALMLTVAAVALAGLLLALAGLLAQRDAAPPPPPPTPYER